MPNKVLQDKEISIHQVLILSTNVDLHIPPSTPGKLLSIKALSLSLSLALSWNPVFWQHSITLVSTFPSQAMQGQPY